MCIYVLHFIQDTVQLATYQEWWKQTFGRQLRQDIGYMVYSTFSAISTVVNFGLYSKNASRREHWGIQLFLSFGGEIKTLANGLQIKYGWILKI